MVHETRLCDDIVTAIIAKLPVKTLVRFTCVSKSWNSLIKNPIFIATHNKERLLAFGCPRRRLYLLHVPSRTSPPFVTFIRESPPPPGTEQRFILKLPFDSNYRVVGSCKGLVCISKYDSQEVCLCNPLLGTFKILPPSPSQETYNYKQYKSNLNIKYGLGYSCKNNDYRIIKIIYKSYYTFSPNKVEIYSLKSDSWKSIIDCAAPAFVFWRAGVFINGCIYWVVLGRNPKYLPTGHSLTIMWFDIDKELFGENEFTTITMDQSFCFDFDKRLQEDSTEILRYATTINTKKCSSTSREIKSLARENSWVNAKLALDQGRQRTVIYHVQTFDGEMGRYKNLSKSCSYDDDDKHQELLKAPIRYEEFHILCVSQSLMLFDIHQNTN